MTDPEEKNTDQDDHNQQMISSIWEFLKQPISFFFQLDKDNLNEPSPQILDTLTIFFTSLTCIQFYQESEGNSLMAQIGPELRLTQNSLLVMRLSDRIHLDKPFLTQFRLVFLPPSENLAQTSSNLQALIKSVFLPDLNKLINQEAFESIRANRIINEAQKISEKLTSLLEQFKQQIDIKRVNIEHHPEIIEITKLPHEEKNARIEQLKRKYQDDSVFRENHQQYAIGWQQIVANLIQRKDSGFHYPTSSEQLFWEKLVESLQHLREQLNSEESKIYSGISNHVKINAMINELQVKIVNNLSDIQDVNNFFQKLPLNELHIAHFDDLPELVSTFFEQINKVQFIKHFNISEKGGEKIDELLKSISIDFSDRISILFNDQNFMQQSYSDFETNIQIVQNVFTIWNEKMNNLKSKIRNMKDRNFERKKLELLQERIKSIILFRQQHHQFQTIIETVFGRTFRSIIDKIQRIYEASVDRDVLDLSEEGGKSWEKVCLTYSKKIDEVEEEIIKNLNGQLESKQSTEEIFKVMQNFKPLFKRKKFIAATVSYRGKIIEFVKDSVNRLMKKFEQGYNQTKDSEVSSSRDIPELSGKIIWAKQIERELKKLEQKINELCVGWEDVADGKELKKQCTSLLQSLDTHKILNEEYNKWDNLRKRLQESLPTYIIFDIFEHVDRHLRLQVNFKDEVIQQYKELQHLQHLGINVQRFQVVSQQIGERYPFAITLKSVLATYIQTRQAISGWKRILLQSDVTQIRNLIRQAFELQNTRSSKSIRWDSSDLPQWIEDLSENVFNIQEKAARLLSIDKNLEEQLTKLKHCKYEETEITKIFDDLKKAVQTLAIERFDNFNKFVRRLNTKIEGILKEKLTISISKWADAFKNQANVSNWDTEFGLKPDLYTIRFDNQVLLLDPPLEHARSIWIHKVHQFTGIVCNQKRIVSQQLDAFQQAKDQDFSNILKKIPIHVLEDVYSTIEQELKKVSAFVYKWIQYQSLWDITTATVENKLGNEITKWYRLLEQVKKMRTEVDQSEKSKQFGLIIINLTEAREKIAARYDVLQKEFVHKFGEIVSQYVHEQLKLLKDNKDKIEKVDFDASIKSLIPAIIFVTRMKQSENSVKGLVKILDDSEKMLRKHRYDMGEDWVQVSNVEAAMDTFSQALSRRIKKMEENEFIYKQKIQAELNLIRKNIKDFHKSWVSERPLEGAVNFENAKEILAKSNEQASKIAEEYKSTYEAAKCLDIEVEDGEEDEILQSIQNEIKELKDVWNSLGTVWKKVEEYKQSSWSSINPRKLHQFLEAIIEELRSLPNNVRQYQAYIDIQTTIKGYSNVHHIIRDLKNDAMKDRHWRELIKKLRIHNSFTSLTLGDLWDAQLQPNKVIIQDIIQNATGELALEEFLRQTDEYWTSFSIDLVHFKNRTSLIRGWNELFTKLEEDMNSINSMKQSPYFKKVQQFQDQAKAWEERLTKIHITFDIWLDVQRRWVYLEGIFTGSVEIRNQLPAEHKRFQGVDSEFLQLMKKVVLNSEIIQIIEFDNLHRLLERIGTVMNKVQKALGEYLERQRSAFSRFYFVGDEDLLEIIGNSAEPGKIVTHLSKMFAALSNIEIETSETDGTLHARAMISRDGEVVPLDRKILLSQQDVKLWLANLDSGMRTTLASLLQNAVQEITSILESSGSESQLQQYLSWVEKYPAQVVVLATQVAWSTSVENALKLGGGEAIDIAINEMQQRLIGMSENVLKDMKPYLRKKYEQIMTELVHQRDVLRSLQTSQVRSPTDFGWLSHLRFYWSPNEKDIFEKLWIRMVNASFFYGFEYLGIGERLVQTPLTDRCFLTLTQALHFRMGGNPFGPAGTGKTESVKALGAQLGRFVLVFNCDESFDYSAMGRIFAGLCQVGAWGCFDEFNRLEERILSAVSQQILTIQKGLAQKESHIEILGRPVSLSPNVGIFVTMNPGYAGRSNLPDNLKQLFRAVAMVVPDRKQIAQVMLFSQGIQTAEELAGKIVLLFQSCEELLSNQSHYDFGLRALKSVLVGAGSLKREALAREETKEQNIEEIERFVLIRSVCDSVMPKLVADDQLLFRSLLQAVFPGCDIANIEAQRLREKVIQVCEEKLLVPSEQWIEKVLQLKQVLALRHGVMMVGPSGSGKSSVLQVLLRAMEAVDEIKGEIKVIDPKAITKELLYGHLDSTTLEWTDGIFTHLLREILGNARGEKNRRYWIVLDGDVDPEWAENLNSLLDDNKILTLPSGERLELPDNVRIIMEVDSLKYATLATVSRCGMVWFSDDVVTINMVLIHMLNQLRKYSVESLLNTQSSTFVSSNESISNRETTVHPSQLDFVTNIEPFFVYKPSNNISSLSGDSSFVSIALNYALSLSGHIMEPTPGRLLETLFSLICMGITTVLEYIETHSGFTMTQDHLESFSQKWLLQSVLWAFAGSLTWNGREKLGHFITEQSGILIPDGMHLVNIHVDVDTGKWIPWSLSVPTIELEHHRVVSSDVVVPTIDTVRHVEILRAWLASHKPLILCGPPGSGKTMTLTSTLQSLPNLELISLNFSSGTTPELLMKTFTQHCRYVSTLNGFVLEPAEVYGTDKWLVIFCDEINLPDPDQYGTQRVITFIRQLTEQGGFWRNDCTYVKLNRIQFVGACNPPTDVGRKPLSSRFLRYAPVLLVDFPATESLKQIYRTFNAAMLKLHPNLFGNLDALTDAMVEFYQRNQMQFVPDIAPQYVYSPRELSRWVRAMYEAMSPLDAYTPTEMIRLWAHEGLRLFYDRLMTPEERHWCESVLDEVANRYFPDASVECLKRPILFSKWLRKNYSPVDQHELRDYMTARLKVFYEEELDVQLVVFDDVLEHVLRIDSVLRNPMGHLLLVGDSGAGKTVLTRFVSWMNNLSVFQIKANSKYSIDNFNDDLRHVMKRVGTNNEKICFIFDESNVLSSAFLEQMNALLASGEVPGLFEGDEKVALMNACREAAQRDGIIVDSDEELYHRFTSSVQRNLHVVFTMNPATGDFENRCMTSPALFNRCVVDWFGTWDNKALAQVGREFTTQIDTGSITYQPPFGAGEILNLSIEVFADCNEPSNHQAVVSALVFFYNTIKTYALKLSKKSSSRYYVSPRDFLDLIRHFVSVVQEKRQQLEEQQLHINIGLAKLNETHQSVADLQRGLEQKEIELHEKDAFANTKLQQMVTNQNEAEHKKQEAEIISRELHQRNSFIKERSELAQRDLDRAEPALLQAQQSVKSINKNMLDEIRHLTRPPPLVQLTLEAVVLLLGEKSTQWNDIRKIVRKDDFISTVVGFDSTILSNKTIQLVEEKYIRNPDAGLEYDAVNNASRACGPLYAWLVSQVEYARILQNIEPLRKEVKELQEESQHLLTQKELIDNQIQTLEDSISKFKTEYSSSIREIEAIKAEMNTVKEKVQRAEALIENLSQEKVRWESSSESFQTQLDCLIGDSLLSAGFLTYIGIFDHRTRKVLQDEWREALSTLGLPFRSELSLTEYLSTASERLDWQSKGLPADQLCYENAIVMEKFNRFPLVIDPSGQAKAFIVNKLKLRKLVVTSFLDNAFMKTLASAIRFGTALLVEDVENIDPILNPVLNKEVQKTGGRTIIRLGSEDIDFSPKFMIILMTRNPAAQFSPDLCSRVTIVNFTVTPESLESQVLGKLLKAERPDIEHRRNEILKLQGEQNVKLRELEQTLLAQISAVKGNILNDDTVIKALEQLKREATDVGIEVEKTKQVLLSVQKVSDTYQPLAIACSQTYFCIEKLAEVHFLYQFSLSMFLNILDHVLSSGSDISRQSDDFAIKRITELKYSLFSKISQRVSLSLLFEDKCMFAMRLTQIYLNGDRARAPLEVEYDFLCRGAGFLSSTLHHTNSSKIKSFAKYLPPSKQNDEKLCADLMGLTLLPSYGKFLESLENQSDWELFFDNSSVDCFDTIPSSWIENISSTCFERKLFLKLLVVKVFRPDQLLSCMEKYIEVIFGKDFPWRGEMSLLDVVSVISNANSPIMVCSEPGYDASSKVDGLAVHVKKRFDSVAMGSSEGFDISDRLIAIAAKEGNWVLLRNVHLCPEWLSNLEKRLYSLPKHPEFRLFLTSEIHPKLPISLLRISDVIVNDAPTGIKASLIRFFNNINSNRMENQSVGKNQLYFLLSWLHSVIVERLRYRPIGWSKSYEFNETDAICSLNILDHWYDKVAGVRQNVSPDEIPWEAIRTMLSQSIYGGRIDSTFDQQLLDSFINHLFRTESFNIDFPLATSLDSSGQQISLITGPESFTRHEITQWISNLPDINPTTWLGLPTTAEAQLQSQKGLRVLVKMSITQELFDEQFQSTPTSSTNNNNQNSTFTSTTSMTAISPKLQQLLNQVSHWLENILPIAIQTENFNTTELPDALRRCISREIIRGQTLLLLIRNDLQQIIDFCLGKIKATNLLRDLVKTLSKNFPPIRWTSEYNCANLSSNDWIKDFANRLNQLQRLAKCRPNNNHNNNRKTDNSVDELVKQNFWLGGFFSPEAFITATRQYVAHINKWPLDQLQLVLEIGNSVSSTNTFVFSGLTLEGAVWKDCSLQLAHEDVHWCSLPLTAIRWDLPNEESSQNSLNKMNSVRLPMYLNDDRKNLLVSVSLELSPSYVYPEAIWSQRCVALTAWNQSFTY